MKYSKHAKDQMQDRSITESEVKECLAGWNIRCTDKKGNPIYKATLRSGRGIKAVVAKDDSDFIITVANF